MIQHGFFLVVQMHPEEPEPRKETSNVRIQTTIVFTALVVAMAILPGFPVLAADAPEVTVRNYVRAETDLQMRNYIESMDAFGKFAHVREATRPPTRPCSF